MMISSQHVAGEGEMLSITRTTTALLEGLLDESNEAAWAEFDARYRPIVFAFARKLGLGEPDAADAAQDTIVRFMEEYRAGKYVRERGRLRSWIVAIARCRIADLQRARGRRREKRGESALLGVEDPAHLEELWDAECRRAILDHAMRELRLSTRLDRRTIRAFELVAREGRSPDDAAAELDMTASEVYVAKHRVLSKLREIADELHRLYESEP